ncbi:MAG TPA: Gfo/Idh/MocA family oxidoreductase [Chitinophagaceae bacterium]|nr:Gfo/Idh/MocA family oxidoreductase [Chitinophagaceae bacterium]
MAKQTASSRRKFLQQLGTTTLLLGTGGLSKLAAEEKMEERMLQYRKPISANDKIRVAVIGCGIMGFNDIGTALKVPGVEIGAACDLYTGRLERMKEVYGKDLFTTRDYREVLERKDIDAVIIATSDNWHARISTDAMNKGKHVYCEKPMVHRISEGLGVIKTQEQTKKVMQVGSQGISGVDYLKAKELYRAGDIGQLNCIEATYDRQSALGAWQYTMPTDASATTVDWDRYIAGMPKQPYDAKKFFWWRNYKDFGTGMPGDLFVHLVTGIHYVTGSKGPSKIFSAGQLAYWKDGRDVPDVTTAIMDYPATAEHPAFQVMLRVNFISGDGGGSSVKFIGSEGVIEKTGDGLNVTHSLLPKAPGIGGWDALSTYPQAMQEELKKQYDQQWTAADKQAAVKAPIKFKKPEGYSEHVDHFINFFDAVKTGSPVIEGPVTAFRAAAPCLASNDSYFQKKIIYWDAENMKVLSS